MSTGNAITIELPPELYTQVQEIAAQRQTSLQDAVLETLMLYLVKPVEDIETRLSVMEAFSDEQLWAILGRVFPEEKAARLKQIITEGEESGFLEENKPELHDLIDSEDYHILLRSKALVLLKERGYDVDAYLRAGTP